MKSENALHHNMRVTARGLLLALLTAIVAISIWTPLAQPAIAERWFSLPNLFFLLPVPLLVAAISAGYGERFTTAPATCYRSFLRWG